MPSISTDQLDSGDDSPKLARGSLLLAVQAINNLFSFLDPDTNTANLAISRNVNITGNLSFTGTFSGTVPTATVSGSAAKLTTGRTIGLTGDITYTSPAFDGSANVTAAATLATVNAAPGSFGTTSQTLTVVVNAKGLVTGVTAANIAIDAAQVSSGTFGNARIAQSSVTQYQSALTILETQITPGSLLARLASNQTVTGAWTFSQTITGNVNGALSGNVLSASYTNMNDAHLVGLQSFITSNTTSNTPGAQPIGGGIEYRRSNNATTASAGSFQFFASNDNLNNFWLRKLLTNAATQPNEVWGNWSRILTDQDTITATNAATLTTPRAISMTGDGTWTTTFDGSANVTSALTLATVNSSSVTSAFVKVTTNVKGLVTATTPVVASDITSLVNAAYVAKAGDTMTGALNITMPGVASGLVALSGVAGNGTAIAIGRTVMDAQLAIAGFAGSWLPGTAVGDLAIRTISTTGQILFGRGGGSTPVTSMLIDGNGTVGVNVVPSAWGTGGGIIDLGQKGSVRGNNGGAALEYNVYYDGTNWRSKIADYSTNYIQSQGLHLWYNSASVAAGAVTTLVERMRIDSAGNVGIGTANPLAKLDVAGDFFTRGSLTTQSSVTLSTSSLTTVQLASGGHIQGQYFIRATGANIDHKLIVLVEVHQYNTTCTVSILANFAYNGSPAIGNIRCVGDASGANRYLVIDTLTASALSITVGAVGGTPCLAPLLVPGGSTALTATYTTAIDYLSNVGIGRISTGEKLEVAGAIAVYGALATLGASKFALDVPVAGTARLLSLGANTTTAGTFNFYQASSDNSVNRTALSIDTNGNVGIGASSMFGKLSVLSSSSSAATNAAWSNQFSTFGPNVGSAGGAAFGIGYNNTLGQSELLSLAPGTLWKPLALFSQGLIFNTTNAAEAARFDASGNLNIGTPTAISNSKLTITSSTAVCSVLNSTYSTGGWQGFAQNGTFFGYMGNAGSLVIGATQNDLGIRFETGLSIAGAGGAQVAKFTGTGAVISNSAIGYTFVNANSGNNYYYLICTLPSSNDGTYDQATLLCNFNDNWNSGSNRTARMMFANRGGFTGRFLSHEGGAQTPASRIQAYTQSNGTTQIYAVLISGYYSTISYQIATSTLVSIVANPTLITTTPPGTLVFDTATAVPNYAIDAANSFFLGCSSISSGPQSGFVVIPNNTGYTSTVTAHPNGTVNGAYYAYFDYNGTAIGSITQSGTTGVLYNTTSDYRLKNITGPVSKSGAFIDALKPSVGTWKADGSPFVGFVAHEFQEVSPSSVGGEKDAEDADGKPIMQSMQASSPEVMANIIAELQSLRARVAALEAK